jgi:hypothetical protein
METNFCAVVPLLSHKQQLVIYDICEPDEHATGVVNGV